MKFKNLIKINDIYFINEYLKKINKNFEIFYNTRLNKYEIHNTSLKNSFVISYDKYPNEGLIVKFFKTSRENINKTLKDMEEQNDKITSYKNNLIYDNSKEKMKEIISFAQSKGDGNLSSSQIRNILG